MGGRLSPETTLEQWRNGVMLDGRKTLPAQVTVLESHPEHKTLLRIILKEGKNRQIRRVAEQLGYPVIHLHRTAIGPIQLNAAGSPLVNGALPTIERCRDRFLENSNCPTIRKDACEEENRK